MPSYAWSCAACGAVCPSITETCSTCGCPAISTVSQQEAFRAALRGIAPSVRLPVAEAKVDPEVALRLRALRLAVISLVAGGALASVALAWLLHQVWPWSNTKPGVAVISFISLAVVFWPCAQYLNKTRCPRCKEPWLAQAHSQDRDGWFALWAFAHWRSCAHCGLSVSAQARTQ
jgi:hypothetical protein